MSHQSINNIMLSSAFNTRDLLDHLVNGIEFTEGGALDFFAAVALLMPNRPKTKDAENEAIYAYDLAEAMLEERKRRILLREREGLNNR